MSALLYRLVQDDDIPGMAELRAFDWGTAEFWKPRIAAYLSCKQHPKDALEARVAIVCVEGGQRVGLIAGHLTRRFGCDGEVQWLSIRPEWRRRGIASELLRHLADWFVAQGASRVCVDVQPKNVSARSFYRRHGADELNPHWMVWNDIRTVRARSPESAG